MKRKNYDMAMIEFGQAVGRLARRLRAAVSSHELTLTEFSVLARLDKEGPATTADLARAEAIKPQSMGSIIAALEKRGLIVRIPHPTDGRQMNIELTPKGLETRERVRAVRRDWLEAAFTQLNPEEKDLLFKASKIIRRLSET